MIKLYGFGAMLGVPDASPFVLKLQTYMRLASIEYQDIGILEGGVKAPRGLYPFIDDDGKLISDSYFIIKYLKEHYVNLDEHLSPMQQAQAHLIGQCLDSALYDRMLYSRWQGESWPQLKQAFFGDIPAPSLVRTWIANKSQKKVLKRLGFHANKYPKDEMLYLANQSFSSLSTLLGDNEYMFNNQPSSFDATCFGHLAQFILFEIKCDFSQKAESYGNLVDYCKRMEKLF